jgi:hypothetical protein
VPIVRHNHRDPAIRTGIMKTKALEKNDHMDGVLAWTVTSLSG